MLRTRLTKNPSPQLGRASINPTMRTVYLVLLVSVHARCLTFCAFRQATSYLLVHHISMIGAGRCCRPAGTCVYVLSLAPPRRLHESSTQAATTQGCDRHVVRGFSYPQHGSWQRSLPFSLLTSALCLYVISRDRRRRQERRQCVVDNNSQFLVVLEIGQGNSCDGVSLAPVCASETGAIC